MTSKNLIESTLDNLDDSLKLQYVDLMLTVYKQHLLYRKNEVLKKINKHYGSKIKQKLIFKNASVEDNFLMLSIYLNKYNDNLPEIDRLNTLITKCLKNNVSAGGYEDELNFEKEKTMTLPLQKFYLRFKKDISNLIKSNDKEIFSDMIFEYFNNNKQLAKKYMKTVAKISNETKSINVSHKRIIRESEKHKEYVKYYKEYMDIVKTYTKFTNETLEMGKFNYYLKNSKNINNTFYSLISDIYLEVLYSISASEDNQKIILNLTALRNLFYDKKMIKGTDWKVVFRNQNSLITIEKLEKHILNKKKQIDFNMLKNMELINDSFNV